MYKVYAINDGERLLLHDGDPNSKLKCLGTGKQAINSIDSFELTMYPDNPGYDAITPRLTMIEVVRAADNKLMFLGRALKPTGDMQQTGLASRRYICEGELSYLWDSVQPYRTAKGAAEMFKMMLAAHNSQMPEEKRIYPGQMLITSEARQHTWHYTKTMQAIQEYIRDYHGEIRLRYGSDGKMYLDYTSTVWDVGSDTKIELAVNMQSVSWTVDSTAIASGVYAVGAKLHDDGSSAERLELGEVIWNAELRKKYGDVVAIVEFDDVTLASNLRRKAEEWLKNQSGELHQYSVQAVDLSKIDHNFDEFEIGTQYAISNPLIRLDDVVRCIGKSWSINDITKDKLTFGDRYETLTALTSSKTQALSTKIDRTAQSITASQQAFVQQVIANQTALITGAKGGNKIELFDADGFPTDTIWMNSKSVDTATFAVRINYTGIGFWNKNSGGSPIEGPYDRAWTIDGVFNTDYICGKRITGFSFDNGDGTFVVNANGSVVANNITTNNITITGGSINIQTSSQTTDAFILNHNEWTISLSPLQWILTNTKDHTKIAAQAGGIFFYKDNVLRMVAAQDEITWYDAAGKETAHINGGGEGYFTGGLFVNTADGGGYEVGTALETLFKRTGG